MSFNREVYERNYASGERVRGAKRVTFCTQCGNKIEDYASQAVRKFCSQECKSNSQRTTLSVPCDHCGKPVEIEPARLKWSRIRGRGRIFCNQECQRLGNSGEKHHGWIQDRTKLSDRRHSARQETRYKKWRDSVFKRDEYTCQKCGAVGGNLHAHHIKEWEYYPELRYEVSNGMTLCRVPCHRDLHRARRSNRKIPDEQIPVIKEMRNNGATLTEIAKIFGVSFPTISVICAGKKRKHQLP